MIELKTSDLAPDCAASTPLGGRGAGPAVDPNRRVHNLCHVMPVNPAKGPPINAEGARAFAEFLVEPGTQTVIGSYGVDRFGQPLFFPAAGKTDEELGV